MEKAKLEELKKIANCKDISALKRGVNLQYTNDLSKLSKLEEIDRVKNRVLKYIVYKKRTETEIRNKFKNEFDENIFEDVIENLKELGYINDTSYIDRAVNEFMALKNMSIKEMKYKLLNKGINKNIIDDYFSDNYEILREFETKSAVNIFTKKSSNMELLDIKLFLRKKGYMEESIKDAEHIYIRD